MVADRELAHDVAQESFVRAWRAIGRFRGDAKFSTWMHRITVNTAFTHRDRRKRTAADPLDVVYREPESESLSPERGGESAAIRGPLGDALAALPESLRSVVVLKDVYEWTHVEIAEHLGITVTAAKVRLHRGTEVAPAHPVASPERGGCMNARCTVVRMRLPGVDSVD